ncbi:hypothetical protein [Aggregatibacter kilianii]|uniref:hypothetical protein n=1 Tax=Aggregatibacter kilianii TaxID=2025884 RepID=UPI000D64701E|nr:hypothetical protein [Aggregatibacter kilianii]
MNKFLTNDELSNLVNQLGFKKVYNVIDENGKEIKDILQDIIYLKPGMANPVSDELVNKIGNNHMGGYFVEFDWVIDFLITILENSSSNRSRAICILSILNDLSYFEIIEKYSHKTDIDKFKFALRNKLDMYSDKFFEDKVKNLS